MKHLFPLIALIILSCQNKNNEEYRISGSVDKSTDSIIALNYKVNDSVIKIKTDIIDGKFEFSGLVNEPVIAFLKLDNGIPGQVLLEKGSTTQINIVDRKFSLNSNSDKVENVQKYNKTNKRNQKGKDSIIQIIAEKDYDESFVHSLVKNWLYFTDPDFEKQTKIIELVNSQYNSSPDLEAALVIYERNKANKAGIMIPDIKFPNEAMVNKKLVNQNSEFTLIDFGASWCIPCKKQNKVLVEYYNQIKEHGIDITTVSIDKNITDWKKASEEDQIPWRNLIDSTGVSMDIFKYQTVPYAILVDKHGRIIHSNYKLTDLQSLLFPEFKRN